MYWYKVRYSGSNITFYFIAPTDELALKFALLKGPIDYMHYVYKDSHSCKMVRVVC